MNNQQCSSESKKPPPAGKLTKGRQKIEIKQLEKKSSLHVTFTKRRNGLFKKASELCILSGAKIGIIVLSPGNNQKPYCFGHPNIDTILEKYLNNNNNNGSNNPTTAAAFDDDDEAYVQGFEEISKQYEESVKELEKEKERGKEIELEAKKKAGINNKNNGGEFWWDSEDVNGMGLEELEAYVKAMEALKLNLLARVDSLMMANVMETANSHADLGYGFSFDHQN